jgi:hypothetical protein
MPALTEWKVPPANQPRVGDYGFDLDRALSSVVGLHSIIPPDAFSADTLGTERAGNGVIIDEGLARSSPNRNLRAIGNTCWTRRSSPIRPIPIGAARG